MGHFPELPALFPDAGIRKYRGMDGTQLPDLGYDSCVRREAQRSFGGPLRSVPPLRGHVSQRGGGVLRLRERSRLFAA